MKIAIWLEQNQNGGVDTHLRSLLQGWPSRADVFTLFTNTCNYESAIKLFDSNFQNHVELVNIPVHYPISLFVDKDWQKVQTHLAVFYLLVVKVVLVDLRVIFCKLSRQRMELAKPVATCFNVLLLRNHLIADTLTLRPLLNLYLQWGACLVSYSNEWRHF